MSLILPKPLTPEEKQEIIDEAIKQSVGKYGKPTLIAIQATAVGTGVLAFIELMKFVF